MAGGSVAVAAHGSEQPPDATEDRHLRRQEWERQLELLDEEGLELHQAQLRIMREHLGQLNQDVGALRHEVSVLSSSLQEVRGQGLEGMREQMGQLEKTVDGSLQWLLGEVRSTHGQLEEVQNQARSQQGELGAEVQELRRCLGQERLAREELHSDIQESVKRHFAYEKVERDLQHSSSFERLDRLESFVGVGPLPPTTEPACHQERRAAGQPTGGQARAAAPRQEAQDRCGSRTPDEGLSGCLSRHARDLEDARLLLGRLEGRLAACERAGTASDARFAWAKDRVEGLESSCQSLAQELRAVATDQSRQDVELESHCSWVADRLCSLEGQLAEAAEAHGDELGAARQGLEQLRGRLLQLQAEQVRLGGLESAFQGYLEDVIGSAPGKGLGGAGPGCDVRLLR